MARKEKSEGSALLGLLAEVRSCRVCEPHLPFGARPLLAASPESRMVIIGQAPGRAAHESGVPWDDRSGDRLCEWLGISRETFYDATRVALVPMGFCFPGTGSQGDLAPRPECAPLWHGRLLLQLKALQFTILVGRYAFERHNGEQRLGTQYEGLTQAVADFDRLLPGCMVLPHPSPRNAIWIKQHPWFEKRVLPALQRRVAEIMAERKVEQRSRAGRVRQLLRAPVEAMEGAK